MTSITITPDTAKKRLRFSGDCIAVGEHVGVTVSGFADKIAGGKLRLRVILGKRTLAKFPLVMADPGANPPVIGDQWTNPQGTTDAYCELNLNTVQAQKYIRFGMDCLIVLDDVDIPQKYGASDLFIDPWCKECGEDTPYDLDEYPDIVAEMKEDIEGFRTTVEEAKTAADGAVAAANTAANAAQTSSNAAATAQNEISVFKSKFDFSTISELTDADSARAIKNAFNNLLQKLKAVNQ